MKDGKKLVYSGDSLRRFLHRKGLTYKDAAKELGLDKNTIGKAVRGGNMNINVLLSIANHWNFPITDFFIFVNQEECEETYFISPNKYNNNSANDNLLVSEDSKIYKNIKNLSTEELALKASKQQEISLLQNLIRNYQDRIDLLQQELDNTNLNNHFLSRHYLHLDNNAGNYLYISKRRRIEISSLYFTTSSYIESVGVNMNFSE